jgi:unsaturated rhamnogalacturonyl hydrolase
MIIDSTKPVSERMALSVMARYTPDKVQWHYEHGLVLQSIYAVGQAARNDSYTAWVKMMYDTKILAGGVIDTYRDGEFNLDQINPGKMLFDLYKSTGDEKYRVAIETLRQQLHAQPRTKTGGFWHKNIYPWQMWLDGLYMGSPFYARYVREYGAEYGAAEDFADIVHQFSLIEAKARDKKTGLLYHAWDESREQKWSNPDTGCSPHLWGRALGWYCMALVDVLDFIPNERAADRETLIAIVDSLIAPLLAVQDAESGLWYQVLDQGKRGKNYLESSASSMYVYFLFKALRKGYVKSVSASEIKNAALKGCNGLMERMITVDAGGEMHLSGICSVAGLGGNPYRDGSFEYYVSEPVVTDDFKGVGAFIFAALEWESAE